MFMKPTNDLSTAEILEIAGKYDNFSSNIEKEIFDHLALETAEGNIEAEKLLKKLLACAACEAVALCDVCFLHKTVIGIPLKKG